LRFSCWKSPPVTG